MQFPPNSVWRVGSKMGLAASTPRAERARKAVKAFESSSSDEVFGDCAYGHLYGGIGHPTGTGRTDAELTKHVQYLSTGSRLEASANFDAAVLAGILEVAGEGTKPHTIAQFAQKGVDAVSQTVPAGAVAAFEKQLDKLQKVLLVALTEQLSKASNVADHDLRPNVLEKGTQVQRGKDWYASDRLACRTQGMHIIHVLLQEIRRRGRR